MGEAQSRTAAFLKNNPLCIYCGSLATTVDHCPPRCLFKDRQWPEGYTFPACNYCNMEARQDEQAMAVLTAVRLNKPPDPRERAVWAKHLIGVRNNAPKIYSEFQTRVSANETRRSFRDAFGSAGDDLRRVGWGVIPIGNATQEAIKRFLIKFSKAMFYRYIGKLHDGVVYIRYCNLLEMQQQPETLKEILLLTSLESDARRNGKSLRDQFYYRYGFHKELEAIHIVVQFSEQMTFWLMIHSFELESKLGENAIRSDPDMPYRFAAPLRHVRSLS